MVIKKKTSVKKKPTIKKKVSSTRKAPLKKPRRVAAKKPPVKKLSSVGKVGLPLSEQLPEMIMEYLNGKPLKEMNYVKNTSGFKILYIDIETSPIIAAVWGCFNQNISPAQILTPSSVLCYAAAWDHSKTVIFDSVYKNTFEDFILGLWNLLNEADIVVHFNGKRFDVPRINREFVSLRMQPPDEYKQIDLLQIIRGVGGFDSNKLEWVSQALSIGAKVKNSGFPLWIGCMENRPTAWKEMEKYNRMDTKLLKYLYHLYLPWMHVHPNAAVHRIAQGDSLSGPTCNKCGSSDLVRNGIAKTPTQMYQKYKCNNCGSSLRERTTSLPKSERKNVLTRAV